MHPAPTHTTVVDDQTFMREGIRHVLQDYEDVQVVAEAKDGLEAIQYARMLKPDVVLMDIRMPQMNGVLSDEHI
jgi:DNA-binding NarL/FixJ family response regulator